jgi:hypothetical protein
MDESRGRVNASSYDSPVPVSRKRKKKSRPSKRPVRGADLSGRPGPDDRGRRGVTDAFAEYRRGLDVHRASIAAAAATALVAELVESAPTWADSELEDELCARLGTRMWQFDNGSLDDHVGPNALAEAVITAAATTVGAALGQPEQPAGQPDAWLAPWRVLTAVADIVQSPLRELATAAIEELRSAPSGHHLPKPPDGPTVTGPVLWIRDAYGSRFAVVAAFAAPDGPDRWYLWDIDACGHQAFTVHSGYYSSSELAFTVWRAGVGEVAAADATLAPVDDPSLLADLIPVEQGMLRTGGENMEQFAEYHRSKRLGEAAVQAVGPPRSGPSTDLDKTTAANRFTAWLQANLAGQPQRANFEEVIEELADSWYIGGPAALYGTCSPHRVALTVAHLHDYYHEDFAADLVALLPAWTAWLAEHNATPSHLADRCRPYALGQPHPEITAGDSSPHYLARVTE